MTCDILTPGKGITQFENSEVADDLAQSIHQFMSYAVGSDKASPQNFKNIDRPEAAKRAFCAALVNANKSDDNRATLSRDDMFVLRDAVESTIKYKKNPWDLARATNVQIRAQGVMEGLVDAVSQYGLRARRKAVYGKSSVGR